MRSQDRMLSDRGIFLFGTTMYITSTSPSEQEQCTQSTNKVSVHS